MCTVGREKTGGLICCWTVFSNSSIYIDIDIDRYWKDLTVVVQMSDSSGWIFTSKQLSESKESDTHRDDELRYKAIWFMRDLSNLLRW